MARRAIFEGDFGDASFESDAAAELGQVEFLPYSDTALVRLRTTLARRCAAVLTRAG